MFLVKKRGRKAGNPFSANQEALIQKHAIGPYVAALKRGVVNTNIKYLITALWAVPEFLEDEAGQVASDRQGQVKRLLYNAKAKFKMTEGRTDKADVPKADLLRQVMQFGRPHSAKELWLEEEKDSVRQRVRALTRFAKKEYAGDNGADDDSEGDDSEGDDNDEDEDHSEDPFWADDVALVRGASFNHAGAFAKVAARMWHSLDSETQAKWRTQRKVGTADQDRYAIFLDVTASLLIEMPTEIQVISPRQCKIY